MRICSVGDCQKDHYARSVCKMHYGRLKKQGSLPERERRLNGVCSVSACTKPHHARGFCGAHYWHWWNGRPFRPQSVRPRGIRSAERVSRPKMVYRRLRKSKVQSVRPRGIRSAERFGNAEITNPEPTPRCLVPSCDDGQFLGGLCRIHHFEWELAAKPTGARSFGAN